MKQELEDQSRPPETCKCLNQHWSKHCIQCGKPFSAARTEDLAMLVRRLCYVIHVYDKGKDNTVAQKAMDYLKRHGLEGSLLKSPNDKVSEPPK